ncbi:mediator of RNA polymerase II transcription subunit 15-like [Argopecten irradians]|uniref:mediator of RNA polymerase II transcription subunit 15-like n=1 Tax=Argopecten irradians TaxID=31199 RepID=UPI00371EC8F8
MQILVLMVVVLVQLTAGQNTGNDPFAMFNTNTNSLTSGGASNTFSQPTSPDAAATNTFGQQPAPNQNQFGQPQPNNGQPQATQFGQQNQFNNQQAQPGQPGIPGQPGAQPNNQFNGNNPTMAFQQPQFGQQQNAFGNQPNTMNQIGGQPGANFNAMGNNGMGNNGMGNNGMGNNGMNPMNPMNQQQQQLTPDQAFLAAGQWNQPQSQQNNGRTMFSSFDPNNPVPFQQRGTQQNVFAGPQQGPNSFLSLGTPGNDLNTFQDNNLPVGEVDNIRFGIGPNQQPFRMDVGSVNFGGQGPQQPNPAAGGLSPFAPFADQSAFGGMQGPVVGGMPGMMMPGGAGMPLGGMPGGFDSGFGGFGGPAPQGFGSFLPPPPPSGGGIFSRLFGGGGGAGGGGFFSSLFGKKK